MVHGRANFGRLKSAQAVNKVLIKILCCGLIKALLTDLEGENLRFVNQWTRVHLNLSRTSTDHVEKLLG